MNKNQRQRNGTSDPAAPEYRIENVVATGSVAFDDGQKSIDLNVVARKHPDCEYNPERFPGLIMRVSNPKATILLFGSGKMVITGMRQEADAGPVMDKVIEKLATARIQCSNPEHSIQNVVASGNLHMQIYLDDAALTLQNAVYEPEVFPGLIHRMTNPKCCILLFSTGKFVCTGARTVAMVADACKALATTVERFNISGLNGKSPEKIA